ncbi:MAG: serine/threonine-protein kinase [Verrucomicrobiota bacterium]
MANPVELIGRQVGRYGVIRHLASGGMAELYIARQESVGGFEKSVVLKILQPRYAQNPRVVTMFLDEARLAAKLNHPSVVHVYDVAEDEGLKYIAMEYIHGETIAEIVTRGLAAKKYLPLEHAIHIVSQAAAGLAYAHERRDADGRVVRIVHRDVSPTNVLVSYEGQTKIVDFGIARAQDELREESGVLPGKASYMSPEQVRGTGIDHRADIFALGILLYELTLCQRLYRGPAEAVMKRIVNDRIQPPTAIRRDYPPALEQIVMRALEKRAEDRYQSADEMRADLEEFLDDSGLRSGNRRMAIYMNDLFLPGPGAEAAAGRRESDDLDFDRRAPPSMRLEPAPEGPATPSRGVGIRIVPPPGAAAEPPRPGHPAAGVAIVTPPGVSVGGADAGSDAFAPSETEQAAPSSSRGTWLAIAAFIAVGIGTMVILTLR